MKLIQAVAGLALAGVAAGGGAASPARQPDGRHRVLIVSAPTGSRELTRQRQALAAWGAGAQERDVSIVYLDGARVAGSAAAAATIRRRYAIPAGRFAIALVGKDGHVAYRSPAPVPADTIETAIDAMPMRRAGQR